MRSPRTSIDPITIKRYPINVTPDILVFKLLDRSTPWIEPSEVMPSVRKVIERIGIEDALRREFLPQVRANELKKKLSV